VAGEESVSDEAELSRGFLHNHVRDMSTVYPVHYLDEVAKLEE
jgi:hypothetical protein